MSFRKKNSAGDNGIYFNARRLSNPDTKKVKDDRGVGEDGLYGSPQQAYSIPRFVSKVWVQILIRSRRKHPDPQPWWKTILYYIWY